MSSPSPTKFLVDPLSGEVLGTVADYRHTEVGVFTTAGFRRNVMVHSTAELQAWRKTHNNTGVLCNVLFSNQPDLEKYRDPETLFYGNLIFDFDIADDKDELWPALIDQVARGLIPALKRDLSVPSDMLRVWFSGRRGLHIEVPAAHMAVWPHHELNRIYNHYARRIKEDDKLTFLDLSLYGGKHLFRMGHSIHQKTGLYKYPIAAGELAAIRDLTKMRAWAKQPRPGTLPWKTPHSSNAQARAQYQVLARDALEVKERRLQNISLLTDNSKYDRSQYRCIETLFSDGYMLPEGNRNNTAYMLAAHFRTNGFTYEQAEQELQTWASEHCDPPFTSELEVKEWKGTLEKVYLMDPPAFGCATIQRTIPHLCEESLCPTGQRRLSKSPR